MDIYVFALACVAALYPMVVLVKGNPLVYLARIIHESQTRPWDSLHNVLY